MNIRPNEALTYDDVLLVPKLGVVRSRSEVNTSSWLTPTIPLGIPIVAAPMSSVINGQGASILENLGGAAFIHRNQSVESQISEWRLSDSKAVGCAVGITEPYADRLKKLYDAGCRLFCLDIAHGHSIFVEKWLNTVPSQIISTSEFIFGSVATGEAVSWYRDRFYVSAFRVGIGPGAACTTRERTGHGVPQLTAVSECVEAAGSIPVIADGGINTSGDIVKALAAGASSVMLGRLLAASEEAPHPGHYYGMASSRAKNESNCSREFTEGVEGTVEVVGSLESIVNDLIYGVKSGISYSGASSIKELYNNHEFVRVSSGTERESRTRI